MCNYQSLVWYASYGSNLLYKDGFLCYIEGGVRRGSSQREKGCKDTTSPKKNKPIDIPYPLYFAESSSKWNNGGVAFVGLSKSGNDPTVGRMYLITEEQFIDVVKQENGNQNISIDFEEVKRNGSRVFNKSWYGNIVYLGEDEKYPIYTFTHYKEIKDQTCNAPSAEYIQIIAAGLKETRDWAKEKIAAYLIQKPGIKENFNKEDLIGKLNV